MDNEHPPVMPVQSQSIQIKRDWVKGLLIGGVIGLVLNALVVLVLPSLFPDSVFVDLLTFYTNLFRGIAYLPFLGLGLLVNAVNAGDYSGIFWSISMVLSFGAFTVPFAIIGLCIQKRSYIGIAAVVVLFGTMFVISTANYYRNIYPQKMSNLAMRKNDTAYCFKISNQQKQGECINALGQKNSDLDTCAMITDIQMHNACTYNITIKANEYGVCKRVSSEQCQEKMTLCEQNIDPEAIKDCKRYMSGKLTAYQQHAMVEEECLNVNNHPTDSNQCIFNTILDSYEPDLTLCRHITDARLQTECMSIPTQ